MKSKILYVGTYTQNTGSKGIYRFDFNETTSKLALLDVCAGAINPSFLVKGRDLIFAASELDDITSAAAYSVLADGSLEYHQNVIAEGGATCHICLDSQGTYLLGADYLSGSVFVASTDIHGALHMLQTIQHKEFLAGKKPHAHQIIQTPNPDCYIAVDLGHDRLYHYDMDRGKGRIKLNSLHPYTDLPSGCGPRHLAFHPNRKFAYVVTEYSNSVLAYEWKDKTGTLNLIQTVSTLPDNYIGESAAAEIIISSEGDYLYATNRGYDSIVGYKIDQQSGQLRRIGIWSCGGQAPRHICFGPKETEIICANQKSNAVTVIKRSKANGQLGSIVDEVYVPAPACVLCGS